MLRILALATVISGLGVIFFISPLFKVKNFVILQNQACLKEELLPAQTQARGKHILLVSKEKLNKTLKDQNPCINRLHIKKKFPSTIELEVEVNESVVRLENSNFALTVDGLVVEASWEQKKPILYLNFVPSPLLGQTVNDNTVLFTLKITEALEKSDFAAVNIRIIDPGGIAFYNQQDLVAIFSSKKDPVSQVDSLQLVLSKAKIDGTKIAKIDLRFDKPVIVYK